MANTVSTSNFSRPSPQWYRQFSTAMIVFIVPGIVAVVSGWGMPTVSLNHCLLILALIPAVIKGFGAFYGNGQEYTDNTATGNQLPTSAPKDQQVQNNS